MYIIVIKDAVGAYHQHGVIVETLDAAIAALASPPAAGGLWAFGDLPPIEGSEMFDLPEGAPHVGISLALCYENPPRSNIWAPNGVVIAIDDLDTRAAIEAVGGSPGWLSVWNVEPTGWTPPAA